MDDPFLVGVLHGMTNRLEQLQPFSRRKFLAVAEFGDGLALHQLHHEERPAEECHARIEDSGDIGVIHHGQGLLLGVEPGQHLLRVHPELDELDGHLPADRVRLLGNEHGPHAAFADFPEQLVFPTQHRADRFTCCRVGNGLHQAIHIVDEIGVRADRGAIAASEWKECGEVCEVRFRRHLRPANGHGDHFGLGFECDADLVTDVIDGGCCALLQNLQPAWPDDDENGGGFGQFLAEQVREFLAQGNPVDVPEDLLIGKLSGERLIDPGDRVRAVIAAIRDENAPHDDLGLAMGVISPMRLKRVKTTRISREKIMRSFVFTSKRFNNKAQSRVSRTLGNLVRFVLYREAVRQADLALNVAIVGFDRVFCRQAHTLSNRFAVKSWGRQPCTQGARSAILGFVIQPLRGKDNRFAVKHWCDNRVPRVREARPWALLFNLFEVKTTTDLPSLGYHRLFLPIWAHRGDRPLKMGQSVAFRAPWERGRDCDASSRVNLCN